MVLPSPSHPIRSGPLIRLPPLHKQPWASFYTGRGNHTGHLRCHLLTPTASRRQGRGLTPPIAASFCQGRGMTPPITAPRRAGRANAYGRVLSFAVLLRLAPVSLSGACLTQATKVNKGGGALLQDARLDSRGLPSREETFLGTRGFPGTSLPRTPPPGKPPPRGRDGRRGGTRPGTGRGREPSPPGPRDPGGLRIRHEPRRP